MNIIPIQNVWFDDAATSAMGEAFDRACELLRSSGSAVPEIIANLIIQAAKMVSAMPRTSVSEYLCPLAPTLVVSGGRDPVPSAYASVAHAA